MTIAPAVVTQTRTSAYLSASPLNDHSGFHPVSHCFPQISYPNRGRCRVILSCRRSWSWTWGLDWLLSLKRLAAVGTSGKLIAAIYVSAFLLSVNQFVLLWNSWFSLLTFFLTKFSLPTFFLTKIFHTNIFPYHIFELIPVGSSQDKRHRVAVISLQYLRFNRP